MELPGERVRDWKSRLAGSETTVRAAKNESDEVGVRSGRRVTLCSHQTMSRRTDGGRAPLLRTGLSGQPPSRLIRARDGFHELSQAGGALGRSMTRIRTSVCWPQ
jgi:hypothetical protein